MTENLTEKFPNFESLKKGDYISEYDICEYFDINSNHPKYGLFKLKYQNLILKTRRDFEGHLKSEGNGIRILTTDEALPYSGRKADNKERGIRRELQQQINMPTAELSYEGKKLQEHLIVKNSRRVLALKQISKEVKFLPPKKADLPKMISE